MHGPTKTPFIALVLLLTLIVVLAIGEATGIPEEWTILDAAGLAALARDLAEGGTVEQRQLLASYLEQKYLAGDKADTTVSLNHWKALVKCVADVLSEDARAEWAVKIQAAFGETPQAMGALDGGDFNRLLDIQRILGRGPDEAFNVAAVGVIEQTGAWRSWSPSQMAELARCVADAGEAGGSAGSILANHITDSWAVDRQSVRSAAIHDWKAVTKAVVEHLPDEARDQWSQAVQSGFARDWEDLASLSGDDFCRMLAVLSMLEAGIDRQLGVKAAEFVEQIDGWKSWSAGQILELASCLAQAQELGEQARRQVGDHIAHRFGPDRAAMRSLSPAAWRRLVHLLDADLSLNAASVLSDGLRTAYADGPDTVASLSGEDFARLVEVLGLLGDPGDYHIGLTTALMVEQTEGWRSWKPWQLVSLVSYLVKAEAEGSAAKQRLLQHMVDRYMGDLEEIRSLTILEWATFTRALESEIGEADRPRWAEALEMGYADSAETIAALSGKDLARVVEMLWRLGVEGDQQVCLRMTQAVGDSENWKNLEPWALVQLMQLLVQAPDGATARQNVADHVAATYLSDPGATRAVGLGFWSSMAKEVGPNLSDDAAAQWVETLRASFADGPQAFGGLQGADFEQLLAALRSLGNSVEDLAAPVTQKVEQTEGWRSWSTWSLTEVTSLLTVMGESGAAARQRLSEHIEQQYMSDQNAVKAVSLQEWSAFATGLVGGLPAVARGRWADALRSGFADSTGAIAALSGKDFGRLIHTLALLGDKGDYELWSRTASAIESSNGWRTWEPWHLVDLAQCLNKAGGAGGTARELLAEHLMDVHLVDEVATRSVSLQAWSFLARHMAGLLGPEDRALWVSSIRTAYAADAEAISQLNQDELAFLAKTMNLLDEANLPESVAEWLLENGVWRTPGPRHAWRLTTLAGFLGGQGTSPAVADARVQLVDHVEATYLQGNESARLVDPSEWRTFAGLAALELTEQQRTTWANRIADAYEELAAGELVDQLPTDALLDLSRALVALEGTSDSAKQWALRAYDKALGNSEAGSEVALNTLNAMGRALQLTNLVEIGIGYPEFAAAVAAAARDGRLEAYGGFDPESFSAPLCTVEACEIVQAEMIDSDGSPRMPVVRILSKAYAYMSGTETLQQFLEEQIVLAATNDVKARWMVAKAFVEAIYRLKYGEALTLLDEAGELAGVGTAAIVEAMRQEVNTAWTVFLEEEIAEMASRAEYMEAQAAAAEQRGDEDRRQFFLMQAEQLREAVLQLQERLNRGSPMPL